MPTRRLWFVWCRNAVGKEVLLETRVGLVGLGRIGRNIFRILYKREDIRVAAISEVADSFDHWTKRERRRDAVGKVAPPGEGAPGGNTRQERLREVGRRFMGRPM